MKSDPQLLLVLAAAGAGVFFLMRKTASAAAPGGGAASSPAGPVQYAPARSAVPSAAPVGTSLAGQAAQQGLNAAFSALQKLLGGGSGGRGGGGGSLGGGGGRAPSSSSSLASGGGQPNQPATWTDPATGATYDLWTGELLSGQALGSTIAGEPPVDVSAGGTYDPGPLASSTDLSGDAFNNFNGLDQGGGDLAPVDLGGDTGGGDLAPVDLGGDTGGGDLGAGDGFDGG